MKYNRSEIMKNAWQVYRSSSFNFSASLKFAWACAKDNTTTTTTYKWTTPRGAKIEATITVEHVKHTLRSLDGWTTDDTHDHWFRRVDAITMNGKPTAEKTLTGYCSMDCIRIGTMGKRPMVVQLPENVVEEVFGEERRIKSERINKTLAFERKYDAQVRALNKMMDDDTDARLNR